MDVHIQTLNSKMEERSKYKTVKVEPDLIGYAIGTGGSNIKKAKQIVDIISISHNGKGKFTVCGKTAEAVEKAIDILEIRKEFYTVPKRFKDKITRRFVNNIVSKSLARRIIVCEGREAEDEEISLGIIGTKETIEKAKHLLSNHLFEFKSHTSKKAESRLVKATTNKSVTVNISNISEPPKDKTELYKMHSNRRTGINFGMSVTKDGRTSQINKTLKKGEFKPVKASPNKRKHGNLYPRVWNKKRSSPGTNFNSQEMYKQYKDRGRIKRRRIRRERGEKRRARTGIGRGRHIMRVKDKNTRIGIKKAELKLPSPDISVQPKKGLSNSEAKFERSDSDVSDEYTKESFSSVVTKRYKAASITVSLGDFLVMQTKPDLKVNREADSGEHIDNRKNRCRKGKRMVVGKATTVTSKFEDDSLSANDNADLKEEHGENIPLLSSQQQIAFTGNFFTKCDVAVETKERKEEREKDDLDKINEMEVLKYLVQKFPEGCSFDVFASTAYSFFRTVNMTQWFCTRSRRFHIYTTDSNIVYIAPFYRELNICRHYFNPSALSSCNNPNCSDFHICKRFVKGYCGQRGCILPHDFNLPENVKLKEKYGLQGFNDKDIVVLLNWRFPRLCHDYIYKTGWCRKLKRNVDCPHLHYCSAFIFGKCKKGDKCKLNHSFKDPHNSWVLQSCHLKVKSERALKYTVYVPPKKIKQFYARESTDKEDDPSLDVQRAA